MADALKYHIILLPRDNYWGWVNAVREYGVRFSVSVTSQPENAIQFHRPQQVVSVVNLPDAYPSYGDVVQWLKSRAPEVALDVLNVSSPDELRQVLLERINSGLRFGSQEGVTRTVGPGGSETGFRLLWPVDSPVKTQEFGANPHVYRRWGLPGHEGIDFRAPLNANVYACADGEVYQVHDGSGAHPYGIHVRIRHADGYKTIYAHLNQPLVHSGQYVRAGDLIGLADSTGNSAGSHLHLTLKKDGATASGLTSFPHDILDPTPFLIYPTGRQTASLPEGTWPPNRCLVGLHGRVDGPMQKDDWNIVRSARIEALKLNSQAASEDVENAWQINPDMFIMVQLSADFRSRVIRPPEFVRWVEYDVQRFYERGVRYFEIHNEPNLAPEGYGVSWRNGREFGEWLLETIGLLKPRFPEAKFGWPGLAPGPTTGMRFDHQAFLESAGNLIEQMDWLGCHCFWQDEAGMFSEQGGANYKFYRDNWPGKLLFITEFSNTATGVASSIKGDQYVKYYQHLREVPGIGAAFAFAVSAAVNFPYEVWRTEDGQPTAIATKVGSRPF
jgi:murein DD-endopeptidase MepM/ murein hydrolase activator NlpD